MLSWFVSCVRAPKLLYSLCVVANAASLMEGSSWCLLVSSSFHEHVCLLDYLLDVCFIACLMACLFARLLSKYVSLDNCLFIACLHTYVHNHWPWLLINVMYIG